MRSLSELPLEQRKRCLHSQSRGCQLLGCITWNSKARPRGLLSYESQTLGYSQRDATRSARSARHCHFARSTRFARSQ